MTGDSREDEITSLRGFGELSVLKCVRGTGTAKRGARKVWGLYGWRSDVLGGKMRG